MIYFYKISFLFAFLFTSLTTSAQLSVGLKGGTNLSSFTGDIDNNLFKVGFQGGMYFEYQLSEPVFLQSGVMAIAKGNKSSEGNVTVTYSALYIETPIHIAYKIEIGYSKKLVLHAGPYISYGVEGKARSTKSEAETVDFFSERNFKEDKLNRLDYGLGEGISVEFDRWTIDLSGAFGLGNLSREKPKKISNINVYLSMMYRF